MRGIFSRKGLYLIGTFAAIFVLATPVVFALWMLAGLTTDVWTEQFLVTIGLVIILLVIDL